MSFNAKRAGNASAPKPDPFAAWEEGDLPSSEMVLLMIKDGNARYFAKYLEIASRLGELSINQMRWSGVTMLHRAAQYGQIEMIEMIIKFGGDINARTTFGWYTPLHFALANGFADTSYRLMELGARYTMKSKHGEDFCQYATKRGFGNLANEFKGRILKYEAQKMFGASTMGGKVASL